MNLNKALFFVLAFAACCFCCAAETAATVGECPHGDMESNCQYTRQKLFDYMLFVQTWQGSFCADGCCTVPQRGVVPPTGFSIHGLWPEYFDGTYPSCCSNNVTRKLIDRALAQDPHLRVALDMYWPAVKRCRFVRYETEKHGSCAAAVYGGNETGMQNYWRAALTLRRRFDVEQALTIAGVVPSATTLYGAESVRRTLSKYVGHRVNVVCQAGTTIDEVHICVDRPCTLTQQLSPVIIDCPTQDTSCNAKVKLLPRPVFRTSGGCKD